MSMLFSLLMKADAGQAKAELRALSGEVAKGKTEVVGLGNAAAVADGKVDALGNASARAAAQNDKLSQSQTRVQATAGNAAGSVGNLVANFNDVGMMIAAGQNPLQLAIQQGTQITQVIGPMGAAGAMKALGGAFVSMLSPINLVTLGVIAFGSMAVQWLFDSGDAAKSLTERIDDSASAIEDLKKVAATSTDDLRERFGSVTTDVIEMQAALGKLATVKAFDTLKQSVAALQYQMQGGWLAMFTDDRWDQVGQVADILGTSVQQQLSDPYGGEVGAFIESLNQLDTARGPQAQLEVFRSLREQIETATGGIDHMTLTQAAYYQALLSGETQLREAIKARADESRRAEEAARTAGSDNGRMGGPMSFDLQSEDVNVSADLGKAQEMLGTLQDQANVQKLISQYGRESEAVALARLEAERATFTEMVQGMDVAEGVKAELIGAWDAANGLASARIAAAIEAALGPASSLNGLLKSAAGWWSDLKSNMAIGRFNRDALAGSKTYSGRGGDPRDFLPGGKEDYSGRFVYNGPTLDRFNNPVSSSGRGGKSARAEKDAVAELIAKLREEQEVLAETDPVKRAMLKYREQLAEASAAERAEVEGLIRAETQLKAVQAAREYATDAVGDFLDQIIAKGGKAGAVLRSLAAQFLSMAARSVLSGKGWFADFLGISGSLFGGGTQAKADGGMIYGEGGPRADKVPVWASAGEFMVNARATARYRPVLERINSGAGLPGFANGGLIGGSAFGGSSGSSRAAPVIHVNVLGATGNEEIRKMTAEGIRAGLKHYDTYVLPGRVDQINRLPRDR